MVPEISHRCQACGAAFRIGEQFCPQCGAALSEPKPTVRFDDPSLLPDTLKLSETMRPKRGSTAPTQPFKPALTEPPLVADQPNGDQVVSDANIDAAVPTPKTEVVSTETTSKAKRVKDAAREIVHENVRPRVEKLRHASSVVLEEASAIDPSVRFVLIAIFLFIVFIVLLLLSFVK